MKSVSHPYNGNTKVAVIELADQVIGGVDAMDFTASVTAIIRDGGNHIILNMHNVEIINSSGLGMIVAAHTNVRKHGGMLTLVEVPLRVNKLLEMTQLTSIFTIMPTIADALQRS